MCTCAPGTCVCGTIVDGVRQDCGCSPLEERSKHPVIQYLDTYGPLIVILLALDCGAIEAAGTIQTQLSLFMALFFLVFGGLQLRNLREYVPSLARYNSLVKRFPTYGYALPVIELLLAGIFGYNALVKPPGIERLVPAQRDTFYHFQSVLHGSPLLWVACLVTIFIFAVDAVGVFRSLRRGQRPTCACLGLILAVPLSPLTIIEDILMLGAAALLLVLAH